MRLPLVLPHQLPFIQNMPHHYCKNQRPPVGGPGPFQGHPYTPQLLVVADLRLSYLRLAHEGGHVYERITDCVAPHPPFVVAVDHAILDHFRLVFEKFLEQQGRMIGNRKGVMVTGVDVHRHNDLFRLVGFPVGRIVQPFPRFTVELAVFLERRHAIGRRVRGRYRQIKAAQLCVTGKGTYDFVHMRLLFGIRQCNAQ